MSIVASVIELFGLLEFIGLLGFIGLLELLGLLEFVELTRLFAGIEVGDCRERSVTFLRFLFQESIEGLL